MPNRTPRLLRRALLALAVGACAFSSSVALAQSFPPAPPFPGFNTGPGFAVPACQLTPLVQFNGSAVEAALSTPELSTLASLIQAAGLVPALQAPNFKTIFAPTNAAFAKIPPQLLSVLGGNVPLLTSVLTYHVVNGPADPRNAVLSQRVTSLQGQTLFLGTPPNGGPQVNNSNVTCRGIITRNALIFLIDSVLQPQYR